MRLVIALDENPDVVRKSSEDAVLTRDFAYYHARKDSGKVYLVDFALADECDQQATQINRLFEQLPQDYSYLRNTVYMRVFRPMFSVVFQVSEIVRQHAIEEIVLIGGSDHLFLTLEGGEGEGSTWWYRGSWFLNAVIFQYFNGTIPIRWVRRQNARKLVCINYIREKLLLIRAVLGRLALLVLRLRKPGRWERAGQQSPVISVVDLPIQYRHMKSLLEQMPGVAVVYLAPPRAKWACDPAVIRCRPVGLISLVRFLAKRGYDAAILDGELLVDVFGRLISIPGPSLRRALDPARFRFWCRLGELTQTAEYLRPSKDTVVVTNMTFGEDLVSVHEFAGRFGLLHYNFQYAAMSRMIIPQLELADRYYLYSRSVYELYRKRASSYMMYLPMKSRPSADTNPASETLRMTIFTQPDAYTEKYLQFIDSLLKRVQAEGLRVGIVVKPHYRQDRVREFERMVSSYRHVRLAQATDSCESLISVSDMCVSMTSSVLSEALMMGVMGVIVCIDKRDEPLIYDGDACFPEVNFVVRSVDELIDMVKHYSEYRDAYIRRYEEFIDRHKVVIDYGSLFHRQEGSASR